ncbi:hypothetical protein J2W97_003776 [Paenibacillus jamilae]|nr:hypothetical protein [Paenibacillus jamilae]
MYAYQFSDWGRRPSALNATGMRKECGVPDGLTITA